MFQLVLPTVYNSPIYTSVLHGLYMKCHTNIQRYGCRNSNLDVKMEKDLGPIVLADIAFVATAI